MDQITRDSISTKCGSALVWVYNFALQQIPRLKKYDLVYYIYHYHSNANDPESG